MINYLINSTLCMGLLLLVYKLLLEKEKMHHFKRFYLLGSIITSMVIPLISYEFPENISPILQETISKTSLQLINNKAVESSFVLKTETYSPPDYFQIGLIIYTFISALFLTRFVFCIFKIYQKIIQNPAQKYSNSKLILIKEKLVAHSFLSYIFINKLEYENGGIENEILLHESTHVSQKHSYDILFIELIMCVLWVNPFIYFYKKAIQMNHEFLADEAVIHAQFDLKNYQYLLLEKAAISQGNLLTSNFNFSTTKTRLIMMTKEVSVKIIMAKQLTIIPIFILSIFLFGENNQAQTPLINSPSNAKDEKSKSEYQKKEVPFTLDGVSKSELEDFHKSSMKYVKILNNGQVRFFAYIPDKELKRLENIYTKMSKSQQGEQDFRFYPPIEPLERKVPTKEVLDSFKNSKKYGIWINDKRVPNSELNKYKNTDFAEYSISKLEKNAINYGKHYFQIDLMTIEYYQKYFEETIADTKNYFSWNHEKLFSQKKK